MASLASSAVTPVREYNAGGISGKDHVEGLYTLVLTGQGDATDKILATALGFTKIEHCGNLVLSDDSAVYPCSASYDGSFVIITNPENATDASRGDPATLTSVTGRIFISGYR